ncbi:unnamed protein product [Urochloa humidicola]
MALDLNKAPTDDDEGLPDLNKPLVDEEFLQQHHYIDGVEFAGGQEQFINPVKGGGSLPDLNEQPASEEECSQIDEAQQGISLVEGGGAFPDLNDMPANEEDLLQIYEAQQGIGLGNGFS